MGSYITCRRVTEGEEKYFKKEEEEKEGEKRGKEKQKLFVYILC